MVTSSRSIRLRSYISPGTAETSQQNRLSSGSGIGSWNRVRLGKVEACRRVFASNTRWTVVRGSDLKEGEGQGLPVWSRHVGDPILDRNIPRRVDFALLMVEAIENDELVHEAPAIVGCRTASALAHTNLAAA